MGKNRSRFVLVMFLMLGLMVFMTACDSNTTEETGPVVEEFTVQVTVFDESTEEPLDGVELTLVDENENNLEDTTSSEGKVSFTADLLEDETYTIQAVKDGYNNKEESFIAEENTSVTIEMTAEETEDPETSTEADVENASELETAIENEDIETINLKSDISGVFTVLREVVINGEENTVDGDLNLGDGSKTLDVTINNTTVTGVLTVDVVDGSVYLTDAVLEEVVVESVGSNSLNLGGNSSVGLLIANSIGRITGGGNIQNAIINAPVTFDRPPQNIDDDSEDQPEYEDASRFSLASPGEQEIGTAFDLSIKAAFNEDNEKLDGDYTVSVESDIDGSLYSGSTSFTQGEADIEISLAEAGQHQLTVVIEAVTGNETTVANGVLPPADQPDSLSVTSQPKKTRAGEKLSAAVKAVDENGREVPGVPVTASLNFGSFVSGETTVMTDENGQASFDDLVITTARKGYEITFNTEGTEPTVSDLFEIEAGFVDISNSSVEYGGGLEEQVVPKATIKTAANKSLKAGTVGRVTFTFRDMYNNPIRDTRYVSISTLETEVSLRFAKSNPETSELTGEFALNEDMSGAVTDPSDLNARSDNNGQVSIYFRSTYAPIEDYAIDNAEVTAAKRPLYTNLGRISALIDGERINSDNLEVVPAEPAAIAVSSSYDYRAEELVLNVDRVEDEFGNYILGFLYRIDYDASNVEFSDGKNTGSFSLAYIDTWPNSSYSNYKGEVRIDLNDFNDNFSSFNPTNFDGTEYSKYELVGDSSTPYVMDWTVETTVDYPVEFVDSLNIFKTTRNAFDYSYSEDPALGNYKPLDSYEFDVSGRTLVDSEVGGYGLLGRQEFSINTDAEIVGHLAVKLYVDNTEGVNNQNVSAADVKAPEYVVTAKDIFAMNSKARYLGALGEVSGSPVAAIEYSGTTYTWDATKSTASKWYDGETSLVSSVVSANDSTPEFTLLGSNGGSFTFESNLTLPTSNDINTAIDDYEAHVTP